MNRLLPHLLLRRISGDIEGTAIMIHPGKHQFYKGSMEDGAQGWHLRQLQSRLSYHLSYAEPFGSGLHVFFDLSDDLQDRCLWTLVAQRANHVNGGPLGAAGAVFVGLDHIVVVVVVVLVVVVVCCYCCFFFVGLACLCVRFMEGGAQHMSPCHAPTGRNTRCC